MPVDDEPATGRGANVPDLPGCVAVGDTLEPVRRLILEAIEFTWLRCGGVESQSPSRIRCLKPWRFRLSERPVRVST